MRGARVVIGAVMLCSALVWAQTPEAASVPAPSEPPPEQAPPPPPPTPPLPSGGAADGQPAASGSAPAVQAAPPSAPTPEADGTSNLAPPTNGQWVHTGQFGWLWIPYAQQYTYVPGDTQVYPSQYVYYPVYGWRWVVAPWIYGWGPAPYWGSWGPRYYGWYAHPWFRVGGYWGWGGYHGWGRYHGWIGPRSWGGRGWAGAPAYYRTGAGGFHQAAPVAAGVVVRGPRGGYPGGRPVGGAHFGHPVGGGGHLRGAGGGHRH